MNGTSEDTGPQSDGAGGLSALGSTLTGGIQDISALLPLLGTEQCESQIGSALSNGWLHVAATPISIFGSLGIARAGFKTLVAGWAHGRVSGARKLKAAGFSPSGTNLSLIMIGEDEKKSQYLAETRLTTMLRDLRIDNAGRITLATRYSGWNLKMFLATAVACILALAPYVHLNIQASKEGAKLPIQVRWLLPSLRVFGGFLSATMIQVIIQHRLVQIIRSRLVFRALDREVQDAKLDGQFRWEADATSEECLQNLRQFLDVRLGEMTKKGLGEIAKKKSWWHKNENLESTASEDGEEKQDEERVGSIASGQSSRRTDALREAAFEHASVIEAQEPCTRSSGQSQRTASHRSQYDAEVLAKIKADLDDAMRIHFPHSNLMTRIPLPILYWISQLLLALGVLFSVVGYLGCFTVVQSVNSSVAPVVWLVLEGTLSIVRMISWAWNPDFDLAPKMQFDLELGDIPPHPSSKYKEVIEKEQLLPLVRAKVFLEDVTAYSGLLDPFDIPDTSVFYTLTRTRNMNRVLYVTLFNFKERTTRIFTKENGNSFLYSGAPIYIDFEHDVMQTKMTTARSIDPKVDPIASDPDLMKALSEHHDTILTRLQRREIMGDDSLELIKIERDLLAYDRDTEFISRKVSDFDRSPLYDHAILRLEEHVESRKTLTAQRGEQVTYNMKFAARNFTYDIPSIEEAEVALYLTIMEWRWSEWLCAVETGRCEMFLERCHELLVTEGLQGRRRQVRLGTVSDAEAAAARMKREWARYVSRRLRHDKEKALNRLKAAVAGLEADLALAMEQGVSNTMIERLWEDVRVKIRLLWEQIVDSPNRASVLGIVNDEELEEASRLFIEHLTARRSGDRDPTIEPQEPREPHESDTRIMAQRASHRGLEKNNLLPFLKTGESEAEEWITDRLDTAIPTREQRPLASRAAVVRSLRRCRQVFARLTRELWDMVDFYEPGGWKDLTASSSVAQLTHINSPWMLVSTDAASEAGLDRMAGAVSRCHDVIFIQFGSSDDQFPGSSLAMMMQGIRWQDLARLTSISIFCHAGALVCDMLLSALRLNRKIVSVSGRFILNEDVMAALAGNETLARGVISPPSITLKWCTIAINPSDIPFIDLFDGNAKFIQLEFFGPTTGNLLLNVACHNHPVGSCFYLETGAVNDVQRSTDLRPPLPSTPSSDQTWRTGSILLTSAVHFLRERRNTLRIWGSNDHHEVYSVELFDQNGFPYKLPNSGMIAEQQVPFGPPMIR